jgi:hypothetical protein
MKIGKIIFRSIGAFIVLLILDVFIAVQAGNYLEKNDVFFHEHYGVERLKQLNWEPHGDEQNCRFGKVFYIYTYKTCFELYPYKDEWFRSDGLPRRITYLSGSPQPLILASLFPGMFGVDGYIYNGVGLQGYILAIRSGKIVRNLPQRIDENGRKIFNILRDEYGDIITDEEGNISTEFGRIYNKDGKWINQEEVIRKNKNRDKKRKNNG